MPATNWVDLSGDPRLRALPDVSRRRMHVVLELLGDRMPRSESIRQSGIRSFLREWQSS